MAAESALRNIESASGVWIHKRATMKNLNEQSTVYCSFPLKGKELINFSHSIISRVLTFLPHSIGQSKRAQLIQRMPEGPSHHAIRHFDVGGKP
jgi:hypothetical protein